MAELADQFAADHDLRGARAVMWELITGYRVSQITRVAAGLCPVAAGAGSLAALGPAA